MLTSASSSQPRITPVLAQDDVIVCNPRPGPQAARTKSTGANSAVDHGLFAHTKYFLPLSSHCLSRPSQLTKTSTVCSSLSFYQTSMTFVVKPLSIFACSSSRHGSQRDATHRSCRLFNTTTHASATVCAHIVLALADVGELLVSSSSFNVVSTRTDSRKSSALHIIPSFSVRGLALLIIHLKQHVRHQCNTLHNVRLRQDYYQ